MLFRGPVAVQPLQPLHDRESIIAENHCIKEPISDHGQNHRIISTSKIVVRSQPPTSTNAKSLVSNLSSVHTPSVMKGQLEGTNIPIATTHNNAVTKTTGTSLYHIMNNTSSAASASSKVYLDNASLLQFRGPPTPIDICGPIIDCTQRYQSSCTEAPSSSESKEEQWHGSKIALLVSNTVQRWGRVVPVHPEQFLQRILQARGYSAVYIPVSSPSRIRQPPSPKQIQDYDNELVWAIRNADLKKLQSLQQSGRSMAACNKFSESILHMACRRCDISIVQFLLSHGADVKIVDDYGRTALHDACWRAEPRFDLVTLIMDLNWEMIQFSDSRGSIPLHYVREEHWVQWCAFLFHQMERYWPSKQSQYTSIHTLDMKSSNYNNNSNNSTKHDNESKVISDHNVEIVPSTIPQREEGHIRPEQWKDYPPEQLKSMRATSYAENDDSVNKNRIGSKSDRDEEKTEELRSPKRQKLLDK